MEFSDLPWPDSPKPLENPIVMRLSKKYNKTPAQILLRHLIQREIAVIPKSVKPNRIVENFQVISNKL